VGIMESSAMEGSAVGRGTVGTPVGSQTLRAKRHSDSLMLKSVTWAAQQAP